MIEYKQLYAILCKAASDALDIMPNAENTRAASSLLQHALWQTEELYLKQTQNARIYPFEATRSHLLPPLLHEK